MPPPRPSPASRPHHLRSALASALVLVALLPLGGCGGQPFQPTHTGAVQLVGDGTVGQTFHSPSGTVRAVDLLLATYGRAPDPDGVLAVTLRDAASGAVLASAAADGRDLADNTWVRLRFGPRAVTVPATAAVVARWDGATPIALRANVPPVPLPAGRLLNDPYPGGELLLDGERATGDLAFRVDGGGGPAAAAASLARLAREAAAHLARIPPFAIALAAALAGAGVLAAGLRPRRR